MDGKERLRMEEGEAEEESESEEEDLDDKEQRRPSTDDMADRKSGVTGYQEDLGESIKKEDSSVPLEIQLRGPGMQQLYSQACRQGALPLHNTRGLVVGQYRSGKTCVVRRLTGEKAVEDEPITDGIEISPSVMTTTWRKAKEEPDEFKETMAERLTKLQKWNIAKFQTSLRSQQAVKSHGDKTNLTESGESVASTTLQQTQAISGNTVVKAKRQQFRYVTVKQQMQEIPDDVIIKVKERLQGSVTEEQLGTAENPRLYIWDFGGQAAYYGSHQSFFTYRGIYILVMSLLQKLSDPVPDQDYKAAAENLVTGRDYLDHWLNSILTHTLVHGREHTGQPPVVLVLTCQDMVSESEIENYKKDILNHIRGKAAGKHVLPKIFVVDNFNEDNSDIDELRDYLREVAKSQWYMGQEVPITWLHLKSKLMDKRREDDPFCPFQHVVDLARSDDVGITDDSHVADILTFLHDLGDIIFINEPVLRDHVALRPQVMIDVFKTIITVPEYQHDRSMGGEVAEMWRRLENEGILSDRLLTIIWSKADRKMQKPFLLRNKAFLKQLMEKYDLICNATQIGGFEDIVEEAQKEEIYFVPSLLAAKPDESILYPGHMRRYRYPLYVVFDNMFFPGGMFHRLQAICVRTFGLETSQVFTGCGRFPTDDVRQQFVVTRVKHCLKVELLSVEDAEQLVFTQGLPVRKFLSSCLFEIKEKWIPSIQYHWCFGEESEEDTVETVLHPLSDIGYETTMGSSRFPEDFIDVWMRDSGEKGTLCADNSGGTEPVMIDPTLSPADTMVRRIGPVLDYMLTRGALSLEECDRIGHELTYVSRFKELVATVNRAGYTCRRLLSASLKVFAESDMVHVIPSREEEKRILERGKKIPELPRTVFDRIITRHTTASVPIEVEIGGREMRVLYEQACKEGSYQVFYIRLILVGQHGNGKTSLKNSLLLLKFNEDEENTDGIVITPCLVTGKEEWKVTKGMKNHQLAHAAATEMKKMMAEKNKRKSTAPKRADGDNRPKQSDRGHRDQDTKGSGSSSQRRLVSSPSLVEATDSKPKEQTEEYKGDIRIVLGTVPGPSLQQHPPSQHSHVRATDSRPKEQTDEYKLAARIVLGRDDFSNIVGSKEQPAMSIWDFAGHDVYYSSHHVFYSHYAIFILTLNLTKALTEPLEPWAGSCAEAFQLKTEGDLVDYHLESIRAHTRPLQTTASNPDQEDDAKRDGQPPVIVVGTNKDKLKHAQDEVKAFHSTVKEHFKGKAISKHVEEPYFAVDNTMRDPEDPELSDLREFILKVAQQQTHMGREIPIRWLELKSRLIEMEKGGRKYCSLQEVMDATDSSRLPEGFTPERNVVTILRFFHLCGDILFFDTSALRNFVVLDPQWFVDVQKTIITIPKFRDREVKDKWEQLEATGLLEDSLIEHVWSSKERQDELKCKLIAHKDALIKMMEQFDLVLQCSTGSEDEADTGEGTSNSMTNTYFVPSLLTTVKDRQRLYPTGTKCSKPIFVVFDGKFFPVSLYHRLVITCMRRYNKRKPLAYARCARFITSNRKQTFVISKEAHYLKMELVSSEKHQSACFNHGPDIQEGLDADLREIITKWIPGIKYKWCFQCCCQPHKDKYTKKESNDLNEDAFIPITSVTEWFADEEVVCETYSPATTNIDDVGLAHWFQKPKQSLELQSQDSEPATIRGDRVNPDGDVKAETMEDLIRDNYVLLSKRLQVEKLIPQFIQKRLLAFDDQQVIMSKVTTQSRAEAFLQLLSQKGTCTPEMFVEILKKGDHMHIVGQLKWTSTQNEAEGGKKKTKRRCEGQLSDNSPPAKRSKQGSSD